MNQSLSDVHSIIIADDHPLFRSALCAALQQDVPNAQIIQAHDLPSLQEKVEQHDDAQLILLDLHMPGAEGFSGLVFLVAHYPHIPVVIVSAHDQGDVVRRAMDHGASGFLSKSSSIEEMEQAINMVLNGGVWMPTHVSQNSASSANEMNIAQALGQLTPQQFRVASMVSQGLLNKQIAYELNVTEATIKAHMTEIFRKLGLHSRTQVVKAMSELAVQPVHDASQF
ncbi:MAG: response regulator transcription factor [Gammaproteobacteria bacterium]|nr:response regulator transcription factor [Gammaproteobacteria bacterium]